MTDRTAFLAAVATNPDDDLPRLAYADFLDEHNDPDRAAFIRLQCEAARLPPHSDRRFDLERQADDLLREHEDEWVGEWNGRLIDWQFRRGFVHSVRMTDEAFHTHGDDLFRWEPVFRFTFVNTDGLLLTDEQAVALTAHPAFALVGSVRIARHRYQMDGSVNGWLRGLGRAKHARNLHEFVVDETVSRNLGFGGESRVDHRAFGQFCKGQHLTALRRLVLNFIGGWEPRERPWVIDGLARSAFAGTLRHLELQACGLTNTCFGRLARGKTFAELRRLNVVGNTDDEKAWRELLRSRTLKHLTDVRVCGNQLGLLAETPVAKRLRGLGVYSAGEEWDFNPRRARPEWLKLLEVAPPLRQLRMNCHNPGARVFAAMRKAGWLRQLRSLDLAGDSQYGVYERKKTGVDALFDSEATLPRLTRLRLYELADTKTVGQLAAWDGLRRLRTLDLGCDYSGRLFADNFRPTVPLARLRKLSGVKVRFDAECVHLAKVLRGSDLRTLQLTLVVQHGRRSRRAGDLTAASVLRLLRSEALTPLRRLELGFHDLEPFAANVLPPLRDVAFLPHLRRLLPAGLYDTPAAVRRALVGRFGVGAILFR